MSASGAVGYIYENVGLHVTSVSTDTDYIYENVGLPISPRSEAQSYIYNNTGCITPPPTLWAVYPPLGAFSQRARIYGTFLGDATTKIFFGTQEGWDEISPISSEFQVRSGSPVIVEGSNAANGSNRTIPPLPDVPNVQYNYIDFSVPFFSANTTDKLRLQTDYTTSVSQAIMYIYEEVIN